MGRDAAPDTEPGVLGAGVDAPRCVRRGGPPIFRVGRRPPRRCPRRVLRAGVRRRPAAVGGGLLLRAGGAGGGRKAGSVVGFLVHIMLMIGTPGTGKTMLVQRLPTILPPLTPAESLETTRIYSA